MYSDSYPQYGDSVAPPTTVDPYSDSAYAPAETTATAAATTAETKAVDAPTTTDEAERPATTSYDRRSRSRSPGSRYRSPGARSYRPSSPPRRPAHAPPAPLPSRVLGVFGLSIRTQESDLEEEFGRFGTVEKATIVYDQRSDRSRGFGFITMSTVEEATKCVQELNGIELNSRRIRVDYSVTDRPHKSTPGEYMGFRRDDRRRDDRGSRYDRYDRYDRRDRYDRDRDRDRYDRDDRRDRDRDRDRDRGDRDAFGRDRDWRDRRSPGSRRYSPSPVRSSRKRSASPKRDYDGPSDSDRPAPRW